MALILVVDDQEEVRATLRPWIERAGHECIEAADGRKGIAALDRERPDIVVTDVLMPENDGLDVIRHVRRTRPETKVIAISGGGQIRYDDALRWAGGLGADRVLHKPFRPAALLDLISELLGAKDGPMAG